MSFDFVFQILEIWSAEGRELNQVSESFALFCVTVLNCSLIITFTESKHSGFLSNIIIVDDHKNLILHRVESMLSWLTCIMSFENYIRRVQTFRFSVKYYYS